MTGWSTVDTKADYADSLITFIVNDRWSSQVSFKCSFKGVLLIIHTCFMGRRGAEYELWSTSIIRFGVEVFTMTSVQFKIINDIITQAECSHNALINSMNRMMQTVCDDQKRRQWPGLLNVIYWKTTWKTVPDPEVDHLGCCLFLINSLWTTFPVTWMRKRRHQSNSFQLKQKALQKTIKTTFSHLSHKPRIV